MSKRRRSSGGGKVLRLETAAEKDRRKVLGFYQGFTPRTPEQAFMKDLGLLIAEAFAITAITPYGVTQVLQKYTDLVARGKKIGPHEAMAIVLDAEVDNYRWPPK